MKRTGIIVWNMLLVAFVCFWAWIIIPKVNEQLSNLDQLRDGPFKARVIMIGLEGIGLWLALAVCAASLASCFWQRIPLLMRLLFGCILAVFFIGVAVAVKIQQLDMGFVIYGDYVTFLGTVSFFLLPPILLGRDILVWRFWPTLESGTRMPKRAVHRTEPRHVGDLQR